MVGYSTLEPTVPDVFNTAGNLVKAAMVVAICYAFLLRLTLWNPQVFS